MQNPNGKGRKEKKEGEGEGLLYYESERVRKKLIERKSVNGMGPFTKYFTAVLCVCWQTPVYSMDICGIIPSFSFCKESPFILVLNIVFIFLRIINIKIILKNIKYFKF